MYHLSAICQWLSLVAGGRLDTLGVLPVVLGVITIHDDGLARAMNNLGSESVGPFIKYFGKINRFLSKQSTMRNPGFIPRNAIRDIQTAFFVSTICIKKVYQKIVFVASMHLIKEFFNLASIPIYKTGNNVLVILLSYFEVVFFC